MGKGPHDSWHRETAGDSRVFVHVGIVIKIDEFVPQRLAEDQPDDIGERQA